MDSLWMIVAIMAPVVVVALGIIALISRYDHEVEDGLRPQQREDNWVTLI